MSWTVTSLLTKASEHLRGLGFEDGRLDAELLLGRVLGLNRLGLYTHFDMPISDDQRDRYRELVRRRTRHEPVAYILGEREFYGLNFRVDPQVLIPRPESEHLIDHALAWRQSRPAEWAPRVLDLGTGSGCLAIVLAHRWPEASVTAVDQSSSALAVARANELSLLVAPRIDWREGDLFLALDSPDEFDLIISNPPYLSIDERSALPIDVREFEPAQALFSGTDAYAYYDRILDGARTRLAARGVCLMELPGQAPVPLERWVRLRAEFDLVVHQDYARRPRVLAATRCVPPRTIE